MTNKELRERFKEMIDKVYDPDMEKLDFERLWDWVEKELLKAREEVLSEIENELFEVIYLDEDGFKVPNKFKSTVADAMTKAHKELRERLLRKIKSLYEI